MITRFFARKNFLSKITSTLTIAALLIQLAAPVMVAYAVDEEPQLPPTEEVVAEPSPEVIDTPAADTGEVLGEETATTPEVARDAIVAAPATVSATLIVCDTESELPNWGETDQAITATTATEFLDTHPNCEARSGWNFEWSNDVTNPGDNAPAGSEGWNLFGPTDGSGVATVEIPVGTTAAIRQVGQHHYIDFTGLNTTENVSAEFVCGAPTQEHLYNNRESLGEVVSGATYNCIGFNAPVPETTDEPTATLVATKIVCDLESDLPDLAATNTPITATTATDFLATHPGCRAQAGWNFQWSHKSVGSPGDNKQMGGEGWNLVGPTDADGTVTMAIPAVDDITVREERRGGYIGFSGIDNHHASVSAEMVCSTPPEGAMHRYDNREPLGALTEGGTVYCVAFNPVLPSPETATMCEANVNLMKNGSFETPVIASGTYTLAPASTSGIAWLINWVSGDLSPATLEIQHLVAGASFDGAQHAELDGNHPVTIYQNIPTIVGKEYKLDYHYSARPGRTAADNEIKVKVNGVVVVTLSEDGTALGNTDWKTGSLTFVATTASTKVEFTDTGTDTSYGGYLDGISMTCQGDPVPPTPTVTVSAQKVVCDSEANLPNWGNGTHSNISATTAADYVASSNGACRLDPNWQFQWGDQNAADLGNGVVAVTPGYTTFTGSVNIPLAPGMTEIHLREVLKEGYIPFTGQNTTQNVSAEFYCTGDALNYDNWDFIRGPVADTTYHCVGFNAPVVPVDTQTPSLTDQTAGRTSMGGYAPTKTLGEVLGTSTEAQIDEALAACGEYLHSYIKFGQKNQAGDVIRLQTFLNKYMGTKLIPSGTYNKATFEAVKAFQVQTAGEVLIPWKDTPGGINDGGTGYVYKTTKRMINMIMCPALNIAMPELS